MDTIFLNLLNRSITAGWLVLAILVLRLLLRKAPKAITVFLWALVGFRLICPFSFESVLSLVPSAETIPARILYAQSPAIDSGISVLNAAINPILSETFRPEPVVSINPLQIITGLASVIWLAGMAAMLLYTIFSYLRIHRKVREAVPLRDNLLLCDHIDTPFIFGVIRPKIYLPSNIRQQDLAYVIAHEQAHLMRHDHWWKPLGFLLLTVYWFHPLLWVAYVLLCRDIELACDEKVIREMGEQIKKPYSNALINCSVSRKAIAACPLAFGEGDVKKRIQSVLHYQKPALWVVIAAVVLCAILAVGFLTNPKTSLPDDLQVFLDRQIVNHHQSEDSVGRACCADRKVLGTRKNGSETTVYLWVLYEEYTMRYNELQLESGAHIPTVITVKKENGSYKLVEYWEPRDGTYYTDDIREKYPVYLWYQALDSQKYIDEQKANCERMAREYFSFLVFSGSDDSAGITADSANRLEEKYPQYFGLSTENGLTVFIWQMAKGSYSCALLPGRDAEPADTELLTLKPTSMEEMRAIVATYSIPEQDVVITPIIQPYSSYFYEINDKYRAQIEALFWSDFPT